jgi:hypothetical protein
MYLYILIPFFYFKLEVNGHRKLKIIAVNLFHPRALETETENNFKPYIIAEFLVILHLHLYEYWMECVRKVKDRAVLPL